MGEWREITGIWRLDWADKSVWMITFALTVMADLTIAVEVGMALAALLYIFVILRLRNMTAIDASGLHALETLSDRMKKSGRTLILCGARHQPAQFLHQAELIHHVGADNIVPHVQAALTRAQEIHSRFSLVGEDAARDLATARL